MNKNKLKDLTVSQASECLGVSSRTVVNYINAKELEAIKVGKSWYIKKASLDSFSKRFSFSKTKTKKEKESFSGFQNDKKKSSKKYSVKDLRLFQMASETLNSPELKNFTHNDLVITARIKELRLSAIELLGAGYYTYGASKKMNIYDRSREKVGAILAILFSQTENESLAKIIDDIEGELLPAYSALIKRMDKNSENIKNI